MPTTIKRAKESFMDDSKTLSSLDPDQRTVVTHDGSDCLVLAGAGSGKTRSLESRVAWLIEQGQSPHRIVAFSFTRRASSELKERVARTHPRAHEVHIGTFHSLCLGFLKEYMGHLTPLHPSDARRIIRRQFSDVRWNSELPAGYVLALFDAAKSKGLEETEFYEFFAEANSKQASKMMQILASYETYKQANSLVDFADMIWRFWRMLRGDDRVRNSTRERFDHVLVDEVQDLNPVQIYVADLMTAPESSLFMVGDQRQSIYGFRGVNLDVLDEVADKRDMKRLSLTRNYRCAKGIVTVSNSLIEYADRAFPPMDSQRDDWGEVRSYVFEDSNAEALFVANSIKKDVEGGTSPDEIACIYRTNAQSQYLEASLNGVAIPYEVSGHNNFFQSREVMDAIAYLKIASNPRDLEALLRVYSSPSRYLGRKFAEAAKDVWEESPSIDVYDALDVVASRIYRSRRSILTLKSDIADLAKMIASGANTQRVLQDVYAVRSLVDTSKTFYDVYADWEDHRGENLDALLDLSHVIPSVEDMISFAEVNAQSRSDADGERVKLLTIHRSKGLEFKKVYFVGCTERIVPHQLGEVSEERRCAYVAMTRAKDELVITSSRNAFGKRAGPSRFFAELGSTPAPPSIDDVS